MPTHVTTAGLEEHHEYHGDGNERAGTERDGPAHADGLVGEDVGAVLRRGVRGEQEHEHAL